MAGPNLRFLFTDQLRADALGCDGNPAAKTPNLDRIAHEGVRFDSAADPDAMLLLQNHPWAASEKILPGFNA